MPENNKSAIEQLLRKRGFDVGSARECIVGRREIGTDLVRVKVRPRPHAEGWIVDVRGWRWTARFEIRSVDEMRKMLDIHVPEPVLAHVRVATAAALMLSLALLAGCPSPPSVAPAHSVATTSLIESAAVRSGWMDPRFHITPAP